MIHAKYWIGMGSLRRYLSRRNARTSGSRSSPAIVSTGSPGRSCCRVNTSIDTMTIVGIAIRIRLAMKRSMGSEGLHSSGVRARLETGHAIRVGSRGEFDALEPDHAIGIGLEPLHLLRHHERPRLIIAVND